jgi:hypothetical protein
MFRFVAETQKGEKGKECAVLRRQVGLNPSTVNLLDLHLTDDDETAEMLTLNPHAGLSNDQLYQFYYGLSITLAARWMRTRTEAIRIR